MGLTTREQRKLKKRKRALARLDAIATRMHKKNRIKKTILRKSKSNLNDEATDDAGTP